MLTILSRPIARRVLSVAGATTLLMGIALTPTAPVAGIPRPVVGQICPLSFAHPLTSTSTPPNPWPCQGPVR